ncbi:MAG: cysteine--tRNA ligase, partial [Chloroflexota bacterium]
MTRQLDDFFPGPLVSLYVCGVTPYDTTHLGHAFSYVNFDLLIR